MRAIGCELRPSYGHGPGAAGGGPKIPVPPEPIIWCTPGWDPEGGPCSGAPATPPPPTTRPCAFPSTSSPHIGCTALPTLPQRRPLPVRSLPTRCQRCHRPLPTPRADLFQQVCQEAPTFPVYISDACKSVLTGLLKKDPRERLGGKAPPLLLLPHPYSSLHWCPLPHANGQHHQGVGGGGGTR